VALCIGGGTKEELDDTVGTGGVGNNPRVTRRGTAGQRPGGASEEVPWCESLYPFFLVRDSSKAAKKANATRASGTEQGGGRVEREQRTRQEAELAAWEPPPPTAGASRGGLKNWSSTTRGARRSGDGRREGGRGATGSGPHDAGSTARRRWRAQLRLAGAMATCW
jgi:hypothetical protein